MSKNNFIVKDGKGKLVAELGREKPNMRKLAKQFGKRCEKESLALYRAERVEIAPDVFETQFVKVEDIREVPNAYAA